MKRGKLTLLLQSAITDGQRRVDRQWLKLFTRDGVVWESQEARLTQLGWIDIRNGHWKLTPAGEAEARRMN